MQPDKFDPWTSTSPKNFQEYVINHLIKKH